MKIISVLTFDILDFLISYNMLSHQNQQQIARQCRWTWFYKTPFLSSGESLQIICILVRICCRYWCRMCIKNNNKKIYILNPLLQTLQWIGDIYKHFFYSSVWIGFFKIASTLWWNLILWKSTAYIPHVDIPIRWLFFRAETTPIALCGLRRGFEAD